MPQWNDLRLVGKQHGQVIANHLADHMSTGRITPAQASRIVTAHIDKHSRDMLATGTSQTGWKPPSTAIALIAGGRNTSACACAHCPFALREL